MDLHYFTMIGVSFVTKAYSSSISGGLSMIPVAGGCTLGVSGLVSEYRVIALPFMTIHRLLPRYFFSPNETRRPLDHAILSFILKRPTAGLAGNLTASGLYQRKKSPLFRRLNSPFLALMVMVNCPCGIISLSPGCIVRLSRLFALKINSAGVLVLFAIFAIESPRTTIYSVLFGPAPGEKKALMLRSPNNFLASSLLVEPGKLRINERRISSASP